MCFKRVNSHIDTMFINNKFVFQSYYYFDMFSHSLLRRKSKFPNNLTTTSKNMIKTKKIYVIVCNSKIIVMSY